MCCAGGVMARLCGQEGQEVGECFPLPHDRGSCMSVAQYGSAAWVCLSLLLMQPGLLRPLHNFKLSRCGSPHPSLSRERR